MRIKSIVDHTAKALEDMIVKGKLKPGQQVKEQEISTRLGISRPPLREAFKILEAEGLIRREPRRGVFVSELKDGDIWEIYTLKLALYTLGVSLAMDRITNGEVEKLEKVVAQMEKSVLGGGNPDVMKYEELNNLFHEMTANIAERAQRTHRRGIDLGGTGKTLFQGREDRQADLQGLGQAVVELHHRAQLDAGPHVPGPETLPGRPALDQ